jgi:hypothetical protein
LYGSNAFVNAHGSEKIQGMISLDMVSYDPGTNHALIYGHDDPALPLKNSLRAAVAEYSEYLGVSINATDAGWNGQSNHEPFDAAGIPACLLIEGEVWSNPNYHTQADKVETANYINYAYATGMTKSICGWLTDAAVVHVPVNTLKFQYPDGKPEYSSPAGGTRMRVYVYGEGSETPQAGTGVFHYNIGGGWQSAAMNAVGADLYEAAFPAAACGTIVQYYVSALAVGGTVYTSPRNAPLAYDTAIAAYGKTIFFQDNFNTNQGWTVSNSSALTDGAWERGIPVSGCDRGNPSSDYDGSGYCYLTDNAAQADCNTDVDGGTTWLISPVLNLSAGDADVSYALWYTNNFGADPNNDLFKTYVSNNGGSTWILVETIGPATSAGWNVHSFTVGDFVTPTANVKVRFEASDLNSGSVVEAGIDAFMVTNLICVDPHPCPGDLDGDDDVDIADLAQLLANYGASDATPEQGDLDGDGDVDLSDLAALLAVYGTVCQ